MRGKGGEAPLSGCSDQGPDLPLGKGGRAPITRCRWGGSLAGSLSLLVSVSGRFFSPPPSSLAASIGSSKAQNSGLLARFRIKVAHNFGLSSFSFCSLFKQKMRGKGGGAPLSGCSDQGPYLPLGKGGRAPITRCCRGGSLAGSLSLLVSVSVVGFSLLRPLLLLLPLVFQKHKTLIC